jgi:hypothetical protein
MTATKADSTTYARGGGTGASYDVWYTRPGSRSRNAPYLGLDVSTAQMPPLPGGMTNPPAPPGSHPVRIRLADGEHAWFLYISAGAIHGSIRATARSDGQTVTSTNTASRSTPHPGSLPATIVVTTNHGMITIQPVARTTRAQALIMAKARRPVG